MRGNLRLLCIRVWGSSSKVPGRRLQALVPQGLLGLADVAPGQLRPLPDRRTETVPDSNDERLAAFIRLFDDVQGADPFEARRFQLAGHIGPGDSQGRKVVEPQGPAIALTFDQDQETGSFGLLKIPGRFTYPLCSLTGDRTGWVVEVAAILYPGVSSD